MMMKNEENGCNKNKKMKKKKMKYNVGTTNDTNIIIINTHDKVVQNIQHIQ